MDASQLYAAAVLVDESPHFLTDTTFTEPIRDGLKGLNGAFTAAAESHGIPADDAERWMADTERLFNRWVEPDLREAADLSVRLAAVAYILSDQAPDPDLEGGYLLVTASSKI